MGFEVVAIISPAPGKEARVAEGLQSIAKRVHEQEHNAVKYQLYQQTNASDGPNDFVVVEEYADKAAFDHHVGTDDFKALGEAIQKEGLLAKPLDIKFVEKVGGFMSR